MRPNTADCCKLCEIRCNEPGKLFFEVKILQAVIILELAMISVGIAESSSSLCAQENHIDFMINRECEV